MPVASLGQFFLDMGLRVAAPHPGGSGDGIREAWEPCAKGGLKKLQKGMFAANWNHASFQGSCEVQRERLAEAKGFQVAV